MRSSNDLFLSQDKPSSSNALILSSVTDVVDVVPRRADRICAQNVPRLLSCFSVTVACPCFSLNAFGLPILTMSRATRKRGQTSFNCDRIAICYQILACKTDGRGQRVASILNNTHHAVCSLPWSRRRRASILFYLYNGSSFFFALTNR